MYNWQTIKLKNAIDIYDSKRIPLSKMQRQNKKGSYPYCGANGIIDYLNDFLFEGEHILLAEDGGSYSKFESSAYLMNGKFWVNNHAHILKAKQGVASNQFLLYLLNFMDLNQYIVGATRKKLNQQSLKDIEVQLPNYSEQTAIANILSTVDEAIQKAEETITKTERIKQAIMKKLFSKDLDSINIKDIGVVSTGKTPSSFDKSLWNGRTPFVTPGDISGSKYVINTERTVSDKGSKVATLLPRNSLMVVCIGSTIGKVALTSKDMITNQQLNSIIINEDKFDVNFIYYSFLNSSNLFRALAGTAAVPIINKTLFEKFKISFISDKKEQTRIGEILSNLDDKILLQQRRKVKLGKIKQGLMDDLFTGKKRVKIN